VQVRIVLHAKQRTRWGNRYQWFIRLCFLSFGL